MRTFLFAVGLALVLFAGEREADPPADVPVVVEWRHGPPGGDE